MASADYKVEVVGGGISLDPGDLEIGAVEIKDGASDQRATVNASGEQLVKDGGGLGALTEAAPGTDTASSGINGRLQRIAQRITSLIGLLPASIGQKVAAGSLSVVLASDQAAIADPADKVEDAAHVSGDTGMFILAVRNDGGSTVLTNGNGDYSPIAVDSSGRLINRANFNEDAGHTNGDPGMFLLAVRNDNAAAVTSNDADYSQISTDSAGRVLTKELATIATTATLANVNDQATNATLQAANANRVGWSCFNDSTSDLYVKFGATASATSFTVKVLAGQYYEMPKPVYTGIIDGIWTADASGAARLTELT